VPKAQSDVEGSKIESLASDKKHEKSKIDFEEQAFWPLITGKPRKMRGFVFHQI
jgi:hypothetical protein